MSIKRVAIIDYGAGNLYSVAHAVSSLGAQVSVVSDSTSFARATHVILPGVGSMASAMHRITTTNLDMSIQSAAQRNVPILGICLGMHLLASSGNEGGNSLGLNLIPGVVEKLEFTPTSANHKIPRLGWFDVYESEPQNSRSVLFDDIPDGSPFYFAHSFHFRPNDSRDCAKTIGKGGEAAVVERGMVVGTQFHPEKSGTVGLEFLENFLRY